MVTEKRFKKNHPIRMKIAKVTSKMVKSFFFQNGEITILPFWYPKFMENGLKSAFLVGFGQNKAQK